MIEADLSRVQVAYLLPSQTLTASTVSNTVDTLDRCGMLTVLLEVGEARGDGWRLSVVIQDSPDGEDWQDLPTGRFQALTQDGAALTRCVNADECARYLRAKLLLDGQAEVGVTVAILSRALIMARVDA